MNMTKINCDLLIPPSAL